MIRLADGKSAKELDIKAQEMGIPGEVLMERAALSAAEIIREKCLRAGLKSAKILAVCGTGNNGGDGIACARMLYEWGFETDILIAGKEDKLSELSKRQIEIVKNCRISCEITDADSICEKINKNKFDIIIDGIFGVGFRGGIEKESPCGRLVEAINDSDGFTVSLDMPSGVDADSGRVKGAAVRADMTVTFGVGKVGIYIYPGKGYAGEIKVCDIGFPKAAADETLFPAIAFENKDLAALLPPRKDYSNKGDFGKVFIVGGSEDMCGAAYLSALAAYRYGAGLVKIFTPSTNKQALQSLIPEAVLISYEDGREELSERTREVLEDQIKNWANVVVLGPGLGRCGRSEAAVRTVLEAVNALEKSIPLIIDADGLYLFKKCEELSRGRKFDLMEDGKKARDIVLTPHIKELSELLDREVSEVKEDITALARELGESEYTVVIKEAATIVAGGGSKEFYVNVSGNSAMAKAGSGDVLTGIIAANFAARNVNAFVNTAAAVFFHGLAGDAAKERLGEQAVLARDIAEADIRIYREKSIENNHSLRRKD